MNALIDTHVLLWWYEQPKKLTVAQRRVLERCDDTHPVGVCDITLWEIALLVEHGRVRFKLALDTWLARATAAPRVVTCTITPEIAAEMVALGDTRGWDPADRIIVATARVLGVPLVTSDMRIIDSGLARTL